MFRKFAIPAIAALTLAAGLGATPASAQPYNGGYGMQRHFAMPHRVCTPEFKWVKVHNRHDRGWHWQRVYVGQSCHWVYRGR